MLLSTTILPSLVVIVKGSMDKTVNWRPETCLLRMDLDGELEAERNYRKMPFALRIHTPNA